jgi:predicted secreted protein
MTLSEVLVGIFFYVITWWVVLFAVLPWGVQRLEAPPQGHDPGAPAVPRVKAKLLATTLVALVIWGIGFFIIKHFGLSLIDFRSK